jgi:hypothetical protein
MQALSSRAVCIVPCGIRFDEWFIDDEPAGGVALVDFDLVNATGRRVFSRVLACPHPELLRGGEFEQAVSGAVPVAAQGPFSERDAGMRRPPHAAGCAKEPKLRMRLECVWHLCNDTPSFARGVRCARRETAPPLPVHRFPREAGVSPTAFHAREFEIHAAGKGKACSPMRISIMPDCIPQGLFSGADVSEAHDIYDYSRTRKWRAIALHRTARSWDSRFPQMLIPVQNREPASTQHPARYGGVIGTIGFSQINQEHSSA